MNYRHLVFVFVAISALAGCVNPYDRFYQPAPQNLMSNVQFLPPSGEPRIGTLSAVPKHDVNAMFEQGYGVIGGVSFNEPAANEQQLLSQAKKVGAEVVLVASKYRNTVNGAMPITTPTTSTSFSNGTANAFGSGGFATGTYSGMTTTYGSQTSYIPYSVDRYDQGALFFAPLTRTGLGIKAGAPTDEQKQKADTNKLQVIDAVRKDSPAFNADILPGDLVVSVDGRPAYYPQSVHEALALAAASTKPVEFVLLRNGKRITKEIKIPESW